MVAGLVIPAQLDTHSSMLQKIVLNPGCFIRRAWDVHTELICVTAAL